MADIFAHFNQIWISSTDFRRSPQYQISRKSAQWEPRWYVWTDRHDEANRLFSRLRRTRLETWVNKFWVWLVPLLPHGQMIGVIKSHSCTKQALKPGFLSSKQKYHSKQTQLHLWYGISPTEINKRQPCFVLHFTFQDEASSANPARVVPVMFKQMARRS